MAKHDFDFLQPFNQLRSDLTNLLFDTRRAPWTTITFSAGCITVNREDGRDSFLTVTIATVMASLGHDHTVFTLGTTRAPRRCKTLDTGWSTIGVLLTKPTAAAVAARRNDYTLCARFAFRTHRRGNAHDALFTVRGLKSHHKKKVVLFDLKNSVFHECGHVLTFRGKVRSSIADRT